MAMLKLSSAERNLKESLRLRKGPVVQLGQTAITLNTPTSASFPTRVLRFSASLVKDPVVGLIGDFHHQREIIAAEAR